MSSTISARPICHCGSAIQCCRIAAPAMASIADDDDPEVPVQPAADEPGPRARGQRARDSVNDSRVGIAQPPSPLSMRITRNISAPREQVAHEDCRADRRDVRAAADEQARADDAADGDHRDVARAQRAAQGRCGGRHRRPSDPVYANAAAVL